MDCVAPGVSVSGHIRPLQAVYVTYIKRLNNKNNNNNNNDNNDYLKTTNNNYKKDQKVDKKNKNYLKIIIQTDKKLLLKFWLAHFPM